MIMKSISRSLLAFKIRQQLIQVEHREERNQNCPESTREANSLVNATKDSQPTNAKEVNMSHIKKSRFMFSVVPGFLLLLAASWLGFSPPMTVRAQESTANIEGVVTDPRGAVIVGAAVMAQNEATGLQRKVQSQDNGFYTFRLLPVGKYRIAVDASGFARRVLTGIELQIDQTARIDIRLDVKGTMEEETVVAQAPLVESKSPTIGDVIENRRVTELPLNGRNFIQLALLVAGTTVAPQGGTTEQWNTAGGRLGFTSNGQRDDRNVFTLDGVTIQEPSINVLALNPNPDIIQEFKVLQNSYSAEAGLYGGGQVSITTKSGTNEFHGTAYEFLRNDKLDAKNFFDDPKQPIPPYKQNQFGASFGGPIVKDGTFFFGNYEGLRIRFSPTNVTRLPTLKERNGDFSGINPLTGKPYPTIYDPATCPFACTPFSNNIIPPDRISSLARAVLNRMPLPNFATTQPGLNHLNVGREPTNVDQFTVRGDHRLSNKHQLFGRFTYFNSNIIKDFIGNLFQSNPPPPSGFGTTRDDAARNLAIGLTSILSPSLVNEFRFGYNRYRGSRVHVNSGSGFLNQFEPNRRPGSFTTAMPSFAIGAGFADLGDSDVFVPNVRNSDVLQFVDNVVWTRGKHTVKFGADWRPSKSRNTVEIFSNGTFIFNDGPTAATGNLFQFNGGYAFADFLLDRPFLSFYLAGTGKDDTKFHYFGTFISDEFRVTPRLTLTYGLREEFMTGPVDKRGFEAILDPANGNRFIVSAPGGQINPTLLNNPLTSYFAKNFGLQYVTNQAAGFPRSLWRPDYSNWQPRLGLAWDLFGTGKTVVRAGAGIFNALINLSVTSDHQAPPVTFHLFGLDLHRFGSPFPPTALTYEQAFDTGNVAPFPVVYDPNLRNGQVYQWSLDLQHQIANNLVVSVAYSGSHALKLLRRAEFNQGIPNVPCVGTPDPAIPRRINCTGPTGRRGRTVKPGGDAFYRVSDASSDYHGVIFRIEKRFSQGLAFTAGYTFSKSLDTASSLNETRSNPTQAVDNFRLDLERGRSDFNTPHRFVASSIWELPFGKGKMWLQEGAASYILGGWQLGGILTLQSGVPLSGRSPVSESSVGTNKASGIQRPDLIGDPNRVPGGRRPEEWFNTSAFILPVTFRDSQGTYTIPGNAGRNIVDGPNFRDFDLSLQKNIAVSERHSLIFRGDFFNLTNHPNFRNPGLVLGTPNFGVITEAAAPRQIQFSLRYSF
jgi:hypothetical protein